jgi:hypothetical protein
MAEENKESATGGRNFAPPFSLRLSPEERSRLDAEAGPLPLGEYIRSRLFDFPSVRKRTFRRPVQDEQALSQVLAALGRSRLSSNVNQLAKAVHSGSLPVTEETEEALVKACAEIHAMSESLVAALDQADNIRAQPDNIITRPPLGG